MARTLRIAVTCLLVAPAMAAAQHEHGAATRSSSKGSAKTEKTGAPESDRTVVAGTDRVMEARMVAGLHVEMTPIRAATRADSVRADSIVRVLRSSIAKYRDYRAAERDGYKQFAPHLKGLKVQHFTSNRAAVRASFGFNAARPTSLLYRVREDGERELIGAMYTAPKRASTEDLNARVPLGMARWHRHVNFCVPHRGEKERWSEVRDGQPVFGPLSPIATREACDAVGGKFHPQVFGWMVHANVFAGDDPATIWEHEHDGAEHKH